MEKAGHWKASFLKVMHLKKQDSLRFSADIMALKRENFALENQPAKVTKGEIKHVKEPLTAQDSARIADIIYEKRAGNSISLYDSLMIYQIWKERSEKGKIIAIPE
jgi:hypothetical protein